MPGHRSGTYVNSSVAGEECRAFILPPLPPDPPLSLTAEDYDLMRSIQSALSLTLPTIISGPTNLASLGIVQELTGKQRNRLFSYVEYLKILEKGTTPLR